MAEKKQQTEELTGAELVNPYDKDISKGKQVEWMFDSIAPAYDFMNTAMTFGLHRYWRNRALTAASKLIAGKPADILDIATGTGDVAFELHRRYPQSNIYGVDLSVGMLEIADSKLRKLPAAEQSLLHFETGDSLALKYSDNSFDMVTVAYGVRNFEHLRQGLAEMNRVLRPGGVLCIIELSCPEKKLTRWGYNLYSRHIIPTIGKLVSGDNRAYSYLPESIAAAPQRNDMTSILQEVGFNSTEWHSLTFGVLTYYFAVK